MKRKISVTTGTRAEYGIMRSVLEAIAKSKKLELHLIVTGMHLSKKYGMTINEIIKDGFRIYSSFDMLPKDDSNYSMSKALGEGIVSFTKKEIIVSCEYSPRNSKYYTDPRIKWLYCVPKYPCSLADLDFSQIKDFNGYSNHCPFIVAPLSAAINGAKIIEVHITSDKSKSFIDNNVSFDYIELKNLVNLIRQSEKMKLKN